MDSAFQGLNFNPMMVQAQGYNAQQMTPQEMQRAQQGYDAASMRSAGGYNPATVQGGSYASQSLANTDMGNYMNPYTQNVIDTSLQDIDRARQMQGNQADAQATAAGAFGGSRQALMQSENNRNFLDQSARTASQLRNQGYQNAQQMALADIANRNQASQFNIGTDMQGQMANQQAQNQASQFGLSNQQQARLANMQAENASRASGEQNYMQGLLANMNAANQAGQFNAGQALQAQGMNQNAGLQGNAQRMQQQQILGQLANMGFGMGQQLNNSMNMQGQQQRMMMQNLINASKGQFGAFQGQPFANQQMMQGLLGTLPIPQSQTNEYKPGAMDYAGMAMSFV